MLRKLFKTSYIYLWIFLSTVTLGTAVILIALVVGNQHLAHRVAIVWARGILRVAGIRVTVLGREHLDPHAAYILMPNHQSHFDIPVLLGCLEMEFRWLAKAELFRIPIFGRAMRGCGYISIDRRNRDSAFDSIRRAGEAIRGAVSVLIFPEGTRGTGQGILPFKKGGFILAADSDVPILPMAIHGTRRILPKNGILVDPGPVVLCFQPPIETATFTRETKEALMERVRTSIREAFERASREAPC